MKITLRFKLTLLGILFVPGFLFCQVWVKTFDIQSHLFPRQVKEAYDGGILMAADIASGDLWKIGWLIKMDVNGNILWDKKLGNEGTMWRIGGMDVTGDGGCIIAGQTDTLDPNYDPYFMKFNACGEIEYCKIFHTETRSDFAREVLALQDGSSIILVHGWGTTDTVGQYVKLFKVSNEGDIIWENTYFQYTLSGHATFEYSLTLTDDNRYLISGKCDYVIAGQIQPYWVWPMLILVDSTGALSWELPWGNTIPFGIQIRGEGFQSLSIGNTIYTSISDYHWYGAGFYSPCLIKTTMTGTESSYRDLIDNTSYGKASTITKLTDTSLIIGTCYSKQSFQGLSVLKTDTNGNVLKEKVLNNSEYIPCDATLTRDRKYLITSQDWVNYWIMYLYKLNENLEYDSIYTVPRTYDSLCPYPITSSTLFSTCDLATSVQEPAWNTERVRMHLYPNPASSLLHIQLPEAIQKNSSTAHLQVSTVFHRWNKPLWLSASDMFGREVYRKEVYLQEKEIRLDVSSWPAGLYLLRLSDSNSTVAEEKVVVE